MEETAKAVATTATKEVEIVRVKEIKYNNTAFLAFQAVDKNGKLIDVKFCKGCANVPKEPCIIVVKSDNMNVDTRRRYPCLWVKQVEEIKPIVYNNSSLDEYF